MNISGLANLLGMAFRVVCRGLKLWPVVLADLIAEYAEYPLEDRIDLLCGEEDQAGRDIIHTDELWCWWSNSQSSGDISFVFCRGNYVRVRMSKAALGQSIRERTWIARDRVADPEMIQDEFEALNKCLFSITDQMWRDYHARKSGSHKSKHCT